MPLVSAAAVILGPGNLWAAPLGTVEPAGNVASGALAAGWRQIGATNDGSQFQYEQTSNAIMVEEEFDAVRWVTSARQISVVFAMAEMHRQNLALALNLGANAVNDASLIEPPAPNADLRVMLCHDTDQGARWLFRQCFQVGNLAVQRKKAPDKSTLAVTFRLEKPAGVAPFRAWGIASGVI